MNPADAAFAAATLIGNNDWPVRIASASRSEFAVTVPAIFAPC